MSNQAYRDDVNLIPNTQLPIPYSSSLPVLEKKSRLSINCTCFRILAKKIYLPDARIALIFLMCGVKISSFLKHGIKMFAGGFYRLFFFEFSTRIKTNYTN